MYSTVLVLITVLIDTNNYRVLTTLGSNNMKARKVLLATSLLSLLFIVPAQAQTCKVTDPTGSKLNVRSSAGSTDGKVIGKLANGRIVYIAEYDYDRNGKPWVLVFDAKTDRYIGWIFREFVSCY